MQALAALQPYSFSTDFSMSVGIHFRSNQSKISPRQVKKDIQRETMQKVNVDVSWRMEQGQQHRARSACRGVELEHSPRCPAACDE